MLRTILNSCEIQFAFFNTSPMLVKDGRYDYNDPRAGDQAPSAIFNCHDSVVDMYRLVREHQFQQLHVFIPGSTLRGVFRSHMERIARSFSPADPIVCNPFVTGEEASTGKAGASEAGCSSLKKDYAGSCPVCRMFGSTTHRGRISFQDADPADRGHIVETEQISIDRFTGSVGKGPFKYVLVQGAKFKAKIIIRNFEMWQLGLLGYAFKDLEAGNLQIGMGRNLNRGRVECKPEDVSIRVTYYGLPSTIPHGGALRGLYEMAGPQREAYKLVGKPERTELSGLLTPHEPDPAELAHTFNAVETKAFWRAVTPLWNEAAVQPDIFPGRAVPAPVGGD